ncbi:related to vitamin D3 hydroxylase-associated protein [Ramularia collo-cygni]|uniref:amidase n=1 Tax=Ramularia collo-cygni TaxID=112498 RepID=A0A2D3UQL0_9PEZI|nr:related to vitamin D3 hydroxylase-associated protein [Ramularia collo-cygni]CZT16608.1 related to vitamin D3 hydroxylase-associated protein [Ramularia collo-cygni]
MDWKAIARTRQDHRERTIQVLEPPIPDVPVSTGSNVTKIPSTLLTQEVLSITGRDAETLVRQLASGNLTSTVVTKAFLQRAALASRLTNCVTELLTDQALERANFLDEHFSKHGPIGPLHGLPISVKEHISMKDLDVNAGFVSWVGRIGADDALILKLLWHAGAVFHARTTEPQTLMHLETSSSIYGVTVNPYNTNLTSGGSSGGEGALLGMNGSCLGIGTDIGGSIRSPAANNGVYGLRPTSYRLPLDGFAATMLGEEQVVPVVGPLSASLEGIKLFMKTLIDQKPWLYEPSLIPMPWKDTSISSLLRRGHQGQPRLRIGVLANDGIVKPHPPIVRGIQTMVDKLKGHPDIEIVDFPAYKHDEAWRIIASLYFADGAREEIEAIDASGEPWMPLSDFIIKENPHVKALTIPETWKLTCERDAYKAAYARHWNSVGTGLPGPESGSKITVDADALQDRIVDVVLCPVGPGVAPLLNTARYWNYTSQWNLLDYPALVFPTGLACGPEDKADIEYSPRNEQDAYNHNLYDPAKYADAPISLQLVGRRYEDEKVIEALEFMLRVAGIPSSNGN